MRVHLLVRAALITVDRPPLLPRHAGACTTLVHSTWLSASSAKAVLVNLMVRRFGYLASKSNEFVKITMLLKCKFTTLYLFNMLLSAVLVGKKIS